ncbi:unnamed protein product [Rotaria magnacalcarata]|uniref:Uncharacterized protein n=1 Tax=Rotaria magnacalcarata TaxID=392030 RepID=A0A8S3GI01_9BILA|nr:unnamed protein product [Rotaria magnacalcarata]
MSSNARTELIKQLVNDRYNSKHNTKDTATVTSIIAMNKDLINRVLLLSDFTEKSVIMYMNHVKIDVLNDMTLLPFTEVCVICNEVLTTYRSKSIHVIDCFKIIRAVAITAELFFDYTRQLLNYQCQFKAFSRTLIDRYDYEQQNNIVILQPIQLTKLFECHWILYQIVLFEFMLGKTQTVSLLVSLNRCEINRYFENYAGWWYHLFTTFWSRHNSIANIKCDPLN